MYKTIVTFIAVAISMQSACVNKSAKTETAETNPKQQTDQELKPVETKSTGTDYRPAFLGQTRIKGIKTTTPYQVTIISKDLNKPWAVTSLPDGRLLITEKGGTMRISDSSGKLSAAITGIPEVNSKGQGGLLDVAHDPDFTNNRILYWSFSEKMPDGNLTSVAKGKLSPDETKIENATVIYRATPAYNGTLHYGSRLQFDRSGNLYVSTGERSDLQTRPQAQSLQSALGKVLRIDKNGKPAAGNPFLNQKDQRDEIFSYGHRNVQGLAIHPETGDIWENEMGPKGGDEVNLLSAGKNYGWPTITYGLEYSGQTIGAGITKKEGMEQPVYYWDPSSSPSGMTFYSQSAIPEWKNNLFIGALSGEHIIRLEIKNNKVTGEERLLENEGQRFRDIGEGRDGALYAVTDSGRLYKISAKK